MTFPKGYKPPEGYKPPVSRKGYERKRNDDGISIGIIKLIVFVITMILIVIFLIIPTIQYVEVRSKYHPFAKGQLVDTDSDTNSLGFFVLYPSKYFI